LKGLTLSRRARGPGLSRQKREFQESGCSLLASDAGPRAHIENVTRGTAPRTKALQWIIIVPLFIRRVGLNVEFDQNSYSVIFLKSVEKCENEKRKTASEVLSRPRAP
jgi:hypothetical protein